MCFNRRLCIFVDLADFWWHTYLDFFQTIMKLGSYLKLIKVLTLIVMHKDFSSLSVSLDGEHREWGRMERLYSYNNRGRKDITFD